MFTKGIKKSCCPYPIGRQVHKKKRSLVSFSFVAGPGIEPGTS